MFPDVGSTMVPPGRKRPCLSASSIIATAMRSLTDPPGFMYSTFATRLPGGWILESLIIGVFPMAARTSGWISMGGARVSHRMVHLRTTSNLPGVTRIARYAWFTLVFNVGVILLGALVRATGSGAGCGRSWPACQGQVMPELSGATAVEFTHRAASGVALVLVAVLVVWVWRRVPSGEPARIGAGLALAAIVGEALIGAMIVLAEWVAEDASLARVVAVPLHLVNTLFLLAAFQ